MICMWLTDAEFKKYQTVGDEYVNGLLQAVRSISNGKYYLQEGVVTIKGFMKKRKQYTTYILYVLLQGTEVQVVNFCQEREWSINTSVSKSYMVTFLLGIIAGYHMKNEIQHS